MLCVVMVVVLRWLLGWLGCVWLLCSLLFLFVKQGCTLWLQLWLLCLWWGCCDGYCQSSRRLRCQWMYKPTLAITTVMAVLCGLGLSVLMTVTSVPVAVSVTMMAMSAVVRP